jgi:hypothetical protein
VKVLQACPGGETHSVWPATIKRLIHRFLKRRRERRARRRDHAEGKLAAPYEGRRWCDATEREILDNITKIDSSRL